MPCIDNPTPEERRGDNTEAMLCGIVTALDRAGALNAVLNAVDWGEAGVQRHHFDAWHQRHVQQDERRKEREARERDREQVLARLSPEERKALGL